MPGIDFAAAKRLVSLDQVLDLIHWRPTHVGPTERRGRCPIHRSANPKSRSFAVSADGWFCHSCQRCGDQLRLYAEVRGIEVYAATIEVFHRLGLEVPYLPRGPRKPRGRNGEEER